MIRGGTLEKYNRKKQEKMALKKEKAKFFQPNFELNCNFLFGISSNQQKVVISADEMNQRKISSEK
jgi:hypothetical protein